MKLDNNNHSVFALYYHLVLVVKYRRNVFDDDISLFARNIFEKIAPSYNMTLLEWNHDVDHVHIMFKAHPNTEISKFINAYKSASSRLIKKELSRSKKETMERILLESKLLSSYNRRSTNRSNSKVYRNTR